MKIPTKNSKRINQISFGIRTILRSPSFELPERTIERVVNRIRVLSHGVVRAGIYYPANHVAN